MKQREKFDVLYTTIIHKDRSILKVKIEDIDDFMKDYISWSQDAD